MDRIQAQCLCICSGALRCTPVAAWQVDCGEMPIDLGRNIAQIKRALKYKCIPDHPTNLCFWGNQTSGEYDNNFKPLQTTVKERVNRLPIAHVESLAEIIPS